MSGERSARSGGLASAVALNLVFGLLYCSFGLLIFLGGSASDAYLAVLLLICGVPLTIGSFGMIARREWGARWSLAGLTPMLGVSVLVTVVVVLGTFFVVVAPVPNGNPPGFFRLLGVLSVVVGVTFTQLRCLLRLRLSVDATVVAAPQAVMSSRESAL